MILIVKITDQKKCVYISKPGKNIPRERPWGVSLATQSAMISAAGRGNVTPNSWVPCLSSISQQDSANSHQSGLWSFPRRSSVLPTISISKTFVNGDLRQDTNTSDLLFVIQDIVCFMSQGTTLEQGAIISMGTPGGVGMAMTPPQRLKDGGVVEAKIQHLGTIRNKMVFEHGTTIWKKQ